MLRILIEDSEGKSKIAPITPDADITIGRKEGNSIRLKERNVSREHARIFSTEDGLFVEPVKARYGLKVNSSKIDGPTPLALGDEIRIGDYRLYVQDESQPEVQKEDPDAVAEIAPGMRPRLVVTSSNFNGTEYPIVKTRVVIGRNEQCDIHIAHQSVSNQHAEIRRTPRGDFEIRDLNSSNGTIVNGIAITAPTYLTGGEMIALGHVIMRFCAPGDFWVLNFERAYDDRPRVSVPMLLLMAIVLVVLAGGGTFVLTNVLNSNQQTGAAEPEKQPDSSSEEFLEAVTRCSASISSGNYDKAQEECDKAVALNPNSDLIKSQLDSLKRNREAQRAYDETVRALQDGLCDEASDSLRRIEVSTNAYIKATQEDLSAQIDDCMKRVNFDNAMTAIGNDDFDTARMLQNRIKELDPRAEEIDKIEAAIAEKRPAKSSGGSRRSHGSAAAKADAAPEAAAPAPKPKEKTADVCVAATKAKIQKDYAKACKLFKKALAAGDAPAACVRAGEDFIKSNKKSCE